MCGIAGVIDMREKRSIDRGLLDRMNQAQVHRGPDEGGVHKEPGVGLVHRRLSIIDLSTGQQPLFNEDRSVVVVFNGEIYNFAELTVILRQLGHTFRTHSDTEVIVHAWEQWGEACVERFRGMFAFAVWDRNQNRAFFARDRLGIKPLYYTVVNGFFIFASELKSLLVYPGVSRQIDPTAVEEYLAFGYVPEPKTIYENVYKMLPGHSLLQQHGKSPASSKRYWEVEFSASERSDDLSGELIERLREAIKIRLVSEVPLGAFLSGGVDYSAVVALMSEMSSEPVNTCSISFGDPRFNEAQYARQIAERYRTRHDVEAVDPHDFALVDQLAGLYDEPYADSSAMPTYRVCQLARRKVTVALSGDGGDENFAGYRRYRWHMFEERIRARLPLALRRPLFGFLGRYYPKLDWAPRVLRAKTTFQAMARDSVAAYCHTVSVLPETLRKQLYSHGFKKQLQGYHAVEVFRRYAQNAPVDHPLSMAQYLDMKTYLPGDILTKVDRASMAHALEVRVPLLDHEFVQWVARLDPSQKLRAGDGKYVLKDALRPYVDDNILYRPKMGFAVPLIGWFRGPLKQKVRDALLGETLKETGYFNHVFLEHIVDQHQSGMRDYSATIWSLLMFEAFCRRQGTAA